jgi:hypothetical protein
LPTTLAGVMAALEHVAQPEWLIDDPDVTKETVLTALHGYTAHDVQNAARQFPLRLAAALRDIAGERDSALDDWIKHQPDFPSRPEAVRPLMVSGLIAPAKKR